jgi:hypothetical protein
VAAGARQPGNHIVLRIHVDRVPDGELDLALVDRLGHVEVVHGVLENLFQVRDDSRIHVLKVFGSVQDIGGVGGPAMRTGRALARWAMSARWARSSDDIRIVVGEPVALGIGDSFAWG